MNGEETIRISAPEEGVEETVAAKNPVQPAMYVGASEDGLRVFFVTRSRLTKDAVETGTQGMELYEYHFDASEGENWWEKKLVRISGGEPEKPKVIFPMSPRFRVMARRSISMLRGNWRVIPAVFSVRYGDGGSEVCRAVSGLSG